MQVINFIVAHYFEIGQLTLEHIKIVSIAMIIAIITGVIIGIYITQSIRLANLILYIASMIMTIPSVAMFGLLIPILAKFGHGIGVVPAVVALVLYAQLPIIRNTYTAIKNIDPAIIEIAQGMGMTPKQILKKVELPLSVSVIMAGIRTAVMVSIGIATIAAYIGAGGLGKYIFRGIATTYNEMILTGALCVSLLAIISDILFSRLENYLTPKGLKL